MVGQSIVALRFLFFLLRRLNDLRVSSSLYDIRKKGLPNRWAWSVQIKKKKKKGKKYITFEVAENLSQPRRKSPDRKNRGTSDNNNNNNNSQSPPIKDIYSIWCGEEKMKNEKNCFSGPGVIFFFFHFTNGSYFLLLFMLMCVGRLRRERIRSCKHRPCQLVIVQQSPRPIQPTITQLY